MGSIGVQLLFPIIFKMYKKFHFVEEFTEES